MEYKLLFKLPVFASGNGMSLKVETFYIDMCFCIKEKRTVLPTNQHWQSNVITEQTLFIHFKKKIVISICVFFLCFNHLIYRFELYWESMIQCYQQVSFILTYFFVGRETKCILSILLKAVNALIHNYAFLHIQTSLVGFLSQPQIFL